MTHDNAIIRDTAGKLDIPEVELAIRFRKRDPAALIECACRFLLGEGVLPDILMATKLLRPLVRQGNSTATCLLGILRLDAGDELGYAPPRQGVELLRTAAKQGHVGAQIQYFQIVVKYPSLAPRRAEAVESLRQAAVQNDPIALYEMGVLYDQGTILEKDGKTALSYFVQAARLGDADAAFNAGLYYITGEVGRKNTRLAREMFELAARQEYPQALYELGLICDAQLKGLKRSNEAARDELAAQAAEFYRRSALAGCALAQTNYAACCMNGDGLPQDPTTAAAMYALAAIQGDALGMEGLADCLIDGTGVEQDEAEGRHWQAQAEKRRRRQK